MAQMIRCDNERRQPHYFPPGERGSFKIVRGDEFLVSVGGVEEWEEKDFCSKECLATFTAGLLERGGSSRG